MISKVSDDLTEFISPANEKIIEVLCQVLGWVDFSAHFLYLKFFVLTILSGRIYLKVDKYFFAQQKDLVLSHFLSCCH